MEQRGESAPWNQPEAELSMHEWKNAVEPKCKAMHLYFQSKLFC